MVVEVTCLFIMVVLMPLLISPKITNSSQSQPQSVSFKKLNMNLLLESDAASIQNSPMACGKVRCRSRGEGSICDWFELTGSAKDDHCLKVDANNIRIDDFGNSLSLERNSPKRIVVDGSLGNYVANGMTGGEIVVEGNVGDYAARGMRGGKLIVKGSAGDYLATPLPCKKHGMNGGEIMIHGHAGDHTAFRMRRGLIYIGGNTGDRLACNMLAGTILVGGRVGRDIALGNKRGSLVFLADENSLQQFAGYCRANTYSPGWLKIYLKYVKETFKVDSLADGNRLQFLRYSGDVLELGKGEILVRTNT